MLKFNELSIEIAKQEGKKRELPIGQIKEVLRIVLKELAAADPNDVVKLLNRYRSR